MFSIPTTNKRRQPMSFDVPRFWFHTTLALVMGAGLAAPSMLPAGEAEEAAADSYALPKDATIEDLMAFIKGLKTNLPDVTTREEYNEHMTKAHAAIVEACDKILAIEPDKEAALESKLTSLWKLYELQQPLAAENVRKLAEELKDDKRDYISSKARYYLLWPRMLGINRKKPDEIKSLIADMNAELQKRTYDPRVPSLATMIAGTIEMTGENELAIEACETFAASLGSRDFSQSERLKAMASKIKLIGNPIEIEGTLVGFEKLNWADYKGKVVLVEFWATWCGPCLAEMPNVKETYERYHQRGFEVVGISLDDMDDRAEVEAYLSSEKIPWPILFGTQQQDSGWKHPMAVKYGINAIPAMILVNREGNVVTLNARGDELPRLVAKLLGPEE